ncbi:MAG: LysM peptidoglycan-binding domain-containing protein [Anaerolineae bacterium]|nr:LysM peptidoglycan-binding domain-containing protein [Anaerolineae bacterium]
MRRHLLPPLLVIMLLAAAALACMRQQPGPVIIVTATQPDPLGIQTQAAGGEPVELPDLPSASQSGALIVPTLDPPRRTVAPQPLPDSYVVQPGDTLSGIAAQYGTTVEQLMTLNSITNASLIAVGQVLRLPETSDVFSPAFKIIPDSELVLSPGTARFDIGAFIDSVPGYIRQYRGRVEGDMFGAAEIIRRVAVDFSVNPRLLVALIEYRAGWLSDPEPSESTLLYPLGYIQLGYEGLHKQLEWAANRLNEGYYGWRVRDVLWFAFPDGIRVSYGDGLNAGTVAVQYFLSLNNTYPVWQEDVSASGFYALYNSLFGDPFQYAVEPLLPPNLVQPALLLPFPSGELWYYTGGPHGAYAAGSAWAAVDFAPPGDDNTVGCFVASQWATAVANGVIARSERGFVVLDLDGDGNETTGWTIVYLHLASEGRIPAGTVVRAGDRLGHPSCEGGVSLATHLHIARRYNGEWIPATCHHCAPGVPDMPFVMGDWTVIGWEGQEYQGAMVLGDEYRQAEQGRDTPINEIRW